MKSEHSTQLDPTGLKRLHRTWRQLPAPRLALICENLNSPYNVGSIARTAAAYRVDHLWLTGSTPGFDQTATQKVALGTDRFIESSAVPTGADAVAQAQAAGYVCIAIELATHSVPLFTLEAELGPTTEVCLILGHEGHGINAKTLQLVDRVAYLPLAGKVGSLNVAVAAAIAMAEVRRWCWQNPHESPAEPR